MPRRATIHSSRRGPRSVASWVVSQWLTYVHFPCWWVLFHVRLGLIVMVCVSRRVCHYISFLLFLSGCCKLSIKKFDAPCSKRQLLWQLPFHLRSASGNLGGVEAPCWRVCVFVYGWFSLFWFHYVLGGGGAPLLTRWGELHTHPLTPVLVK